jgi:hypothetical protein
MFAANVENADRANKVEKSLRLRIDRSTWPAPPTLPRFPRAFMGRPSLTLSVPAILLEIGYLTTPTSSTGVSLSEFWAWVRYLAAVTADDDLRLTSAFANLDAHQKTILSDDFGMGVPMLWLTEALNLRQPCDGRYFMERFAAQVGATARRTAKRGPNKSPDFVARDRLGIWHVIECKGTQSGPAYQATQIGDPGPPPTGGIAQKLSVQFPSNYSGQRLVCALNLAVEGDSERTRLTIVDPEPEDPLIIGPQQVIYAEDAAERSTFAKSLRLAGFERSAEITAAPLGPFAWSRPDSRHRFEEARRRTVEERSAAAIDELSSIDARRAWDGGDGDRYRGREISFDLPRPIEINERQIITVIIRQGINEDVLDEMRSRPRIEDPLPASDVDWRDAMGPTTVETNETHAHLRIGRLFSSELILE